MIAKVYLNRSKEYLIDKEFLNYLELLKYLRYVKENNEELYKRTKVQIEKLHICN